MNLKKLMLLKEGIKQSAKRESQILFWRQMKEAYLKLDNDNDKNEFLARIFKDKEKEGN